MTAESAISRGWGLFKFWPPLPLWLTICFAGRGNVILSLIQSTHRWKEFIKMPWHLRSKAGSEGRSSRAVWSGVSRDGAQAGWEQGPRQTAPCLHQEGAGSWRPGGVQVCTGDTCLLTGTSLMWDNTTCGERARGDYPEEPSIFFFLLILCWFFKNKTHQQK